MIFPLRVTICGSIFGLVYANDTMKKDSTTSTDEKIEISKHNTDDLYDDVIDIWYWNDFESSPIDNPTTIAREDLLYKDKNTISPEEKIQKLDSAIALLKKRIATYQKMEIFFDEESKKISIEDFLPDYSDSGMSLKFYEWGTIAKAQLQKLESKRAELMQQQPSP